MKTQLNQSMLESMCLWIRLKTVAISSLNKSCLTNTPLDEEAQKQQVAQKFGEYMDMYLKITKPFGGKIFFGEN